VTGEQRSNQLAVFALVEFGRAIAGKALPKGGIRSALSVDGSSCTTGREGSTHGSLGSLSEASDNKTERGCFRICGQDAAHDGAPQGDGR
jgi:hypothetical protein